MKVKRAIRILGPHEETNINVDRILYLVSNNTEGVQLESLRFITNSSSSSKNQKSRQESLQKSDLYLTIKTFHRYTISPLQETRVQPSNFIKNTCKWRFHYCSLYFSSAELFSQEESDTIPNFCRIILICLALKSVSSPQFQC